MIDLYNGELRDILPPYFKYKPEIIAYSAAIKVGAGFALEYAKRTLLFADVDSMPEYLLDYAAIELDAQYYNNNASLNAKRQYIKNALYWKMKAGTIEAVEELARTAFGECVVKTWKNYDEGPGTPGTFRIEMDEKIREGGLEKFSELIESTKNESSHIDKIRVNRRRDANTYVGMAYKSTKTVTPTDKTPVDPVGDVTLFVYGNDLLTDSYKSPLKDAKEA